MKILIVEDEEKVARFIEKGLKESGYEVDLVFDGVLGLRMALKNSYDLLILDVIIPGMNGIDLCRNIRKEKDSIPILMLTALGTTEDKVLGFEAGADDYLLKPFELQELLARIRALTRRSMGVSETRKSLVIEELELDLDKKLAKRAGEEIQLTAKEFALLEYLMRNQGKVMSRTDISLKVWDIDFDTGTNVVDVYINLLRKKIDKNHEKKYIQTRIGMGYIFNP
jgi:DNA-binding response OmpR family regulator